MNVEERIGRAPDREDVMRDMLLFRLRFDAATRPAPTPTPSDAEQPAERTREARPFRDEPPAPPAAPVGETANPELIAAKREQSGQVHHAMLRELNHLLQAVDCDDVSEIPGAIDLWARHQDRVRRVIFEAKTISPTNELSQTRTGFAQLHEYREEYGTADDNLCLVVDRPLSVRRQKLLDSLGVAVLVKRGADFVAGNDHGSQLIDALTEPGA